MKDPFGAPRHNQFAQKPGLPTDQASVADQDTVSLSAVHGSSPVGVPNTSGHNQFARKPGLSVDQASMASQDTIPLAAVHGSPPDTMLLAAVHGSPPAGSDKAAGNLATVVRRMIVTGHARLQDPQPEGLVTRGLQAVKLTTSLGAFPILTLTNTIGLLLVSLSYYLSASQYGGLVLESFFLLGLLLMFVPNLVRLLSPAPTRLERICLLCVLGICCYLVQFMISPLHFSSFDDFLHWRAADDILRTGHLFSENSMLPASPYYPGLEIVTNAISTMTGLNTFYAGIVVIIASRLLMMLSLFLFYEQITTSSRMAGMATLIYMTNPHFLFFDAIYNYETLALPLALFMLYILARYETTGKDHRWVVFMAWIVLIAVTITHHMTDYVSIGLLILWATVSLFQPASHNGHRHLTAIALFGLILALVYAFLLPGNPVWGYLSSYFSFSFVELGHIIAGTNAARPLFTNQINQPIPIWDRLLMLGSVALISFGLPFGLLSISQQHRHNALAVMFGITSLTYPIIQVFRLTEFGSEITDRSAAFLFLPIAYVLTILITHFWPTRKLSRRAISLITAALTVVFLGGVIVEIGPAYSSLPGPYLVGADGRSVEPEGIATATWSLSYLGPDNRVGTDRTNQMLMSTYGHQRIVTRLDDNVDISPIFYSPQFDSLDITILQEGHIHYLAVDTRLSTALPLEGMYFEDDRAISIISKDALTKFNTVTQINRLFDSGDIVIYDTGAFIDGSGP
ncbi:MAG: hypothetical protein ACJ788_16820 [Ktedonobacteraceae bacterium]